MHWQRARSEAEPCLLIIDEIQKISGWSEMVKVLFDQDRRHKDLRVVLIGSASLSLQKGLKESLAGRFELNRAFHWTLAEHAEPQSNLNSRRVILEPLPLIRIRKLRI